jgi:hypothetical protein
VILSTHLLRQQTVHATFDIISVDADIPQQPRIETPQPSDTIPSLTPLIEPLQEPDEGATPYPGWAADIFR